MFLRLPATVEASVHVVQVVRQLDIPYIILTQDPYANLEPCVKTSAGLRPYKL